MTSVHLLKNHGRNLLRRIFAAVDEHAHCAVVGFAYLKSTNGDTHLGGDDFDHVIIDWLADDFQQEYNVDLRKDAMALQRLKEAAEKAKIELSSSTTTEINLPYIMPVDGVPRHLVKTLTRAKFEQLADKLIMAAPTATTSSGLTPFDGALPKNFFTISCMAGIRVLDGIAPAPRGIPQIEVTFEIDANGILNVSAKGLSIRCFSASSAAALAAASSFIRLISACASARRSASVSRHRDSRRRYDQTYRGQHHNTYPQERSILNQEPVRRALW